MEDGQIVELFLSRDEEAIRQTERKYGPALRSLALSVTGDPSDAEECENDTYAEAWALIPPNEPRTYLFAFLARITRHRALDVCRRRQREKRGGTVVELTDELADCISDSEPQADGMALAEVIGAYLRSQPERKRNMFLRRYWYMDPVRDIAARFGVSQGSVRVTLLRMRRELKERLEKEGFVI